MRCYVCLEPCEHCSPCSCGARVCRGCLFELHARGFHHCTLCGGDLESLNWLVFVALLLLRLLCL